MSIARIIRALAELQLRRSGTIVLVVALLAILGAAASSRLELHTRFDQLLPEDAPSRVEMTRLSQHVETAQTILVVLEGTDRTAVRTTADALVPKLRALGPNRVASADDGVQSARAFIMPRSGLFLSLEELAKLRADVDDRWDREVAKQTGTSLDDDDDAAPQPAWADRLGAARDRVGREARFPDGYYERDDRDQTAVVVVVRSPVPAGDLPKTRTAVDAVRATTLGAVPKSVRVSFAGDMVASLDEYGAVRADLLGVGVTGIVLVLGVILLYFVRLRALLVLGASIAAGLAVTFGLTALAIGHLNIATGFLVSIVAGNGINPGIIYLGRYDEERRRGAGVNEAVRMAHATTWPSTLMAAVAAAVAYASLAFTKFPALRELAFIGAVGMMVCWLATLVLLPALLRLTDAHRPAPRRGVPYGHAFAWLVSRSPALFATVGIGVAVAGAYAVTRYVASDPIEYDMRKIQTDRGKDDARTHAWDVATEVLGQWPQAAVVLTRTPEQARDVARVVATQGHAVGPIHTVFDLVPGDQEAKLPELLAVAARVRRAHELRMMSDDEWKSVEPVLPPPDLQAFGTGDLPADLAAPFTEKDGTRGTLVLIEPPSEQSAEDLHFLLRYADAFREIRLPDGSVVHGSGRAVVFADILRAVVHDIPRAIGMSFAMTVIAVALAMRRGGTSAWVLTSLGIGAAAVALFLRVGHVRINFLNFAALPITFGIGVDYAVNVMQRHRQERGADITSTLRTAGGAVVLCSLTTMLGYLALLRSHNQAIRSFGAIAVVGEVSCLLAAMVVLPAMLRLASERRLRVLAHEDCP